MLATLTSHLAAFLAAAIGSPWIYWHENHILSKGDPLPSQLLLWAKQQGIKNPKEIRLIRAHLIPLPAPMFVRRLLHQHGFPSLNLAGLSLRHGIYLAPHLPDENAILKHELIHTRQYQQAGSLFSFLRRYLYQCLTEGYYHCQMEREARDER